LVARLGSGGPNAAPAIAFGEEILAVREQEDG
jgi:hypothetical protein